MKEKFLELSQTNRLILILSFLKSLTLFAGAVHGPVYMLFLLTFLTQFRANLVNAIFMVANFIFEPLSGIFGDKFGQIFTYILGMFLWGLAMITYSVSDSFWEFLGSEVIAALGYAFMADALEIWVRNQSEDSEKIVSWSNAISNFAIIPGSFLGGQIGFYFDYSVVWLASGVFCFIGMIFAILLLGKNRFRRSNHSKDHDVVDMIGIQKIKEAWKIFRNDVNLVEITLYGGLGGFIFQAYNVFWQPIILELGGNEKVNGNIWFLIIPLISLGNFIANEITISKKWIGITNIIIGIPMLIAGFSQNFYVFSIWFILHEFGRGMTRTLYFNLYNRHEFDNIRSSLNSLRQGFSALAAFLGLVVSGWLSEYFTRQDIIIGFSVILLLSGVYRWLKK